MVLTVHFEGLCHFASFYKNNPLQDNVNLDKLWVLLVNGKNPNQLSGEFHLPYLRFSAAQLDSASAVDAIGFLNLHGTDLEIRDWDGNPLPSSGLTLDRTAHTNPQAPILDTAEERSIDWLGLLGGSEPLHDKVDNIFFEEVNIGSVPTRVVSARLKVLAGHISTGRVVRDRQPDNTEAAVIFDFVNGPRQYTQALSESIVWNVSVPTPLGITVVRTARNSPANSSKMRLRANGTNMELFLGNLEPVLLFPNEDDGRGFNPLVTEFASFYKLSAGANNPSATYPVPLAPALRHRGGDPYCPMSTSSKP